MLFFIKHVLEQQQPSATASGGPNEDFPTPPRAPSPKLLSSRLESLAPEEEHDFTFEVLKTEVQEAVLQRLQDSAVSSPPAVSLDDSLLLRAVEDLSIKKDSVSEQAVSERLHKSGDQWTKIKDALERRREAAAQASKMHAAAAELQDSLRSSAARLASRYVKALKATRKNVAGARDLLNSTMQDYTQSAQAGSRSAVLLPVFPFLALQVIPADGWPSTRTSSLAAYRKSLQASGTYFAVSVSSTADTSAPFPPSDFLPNFKQDWKDLARDAIQVADGTIKGADYRSYKDFINHLILLDDPGSAISDQALRRRLVRILMIAHFLNRTFSGALIYYVIDTIFSARSTMDASPLNTPQEGGGRQTKPKQTKVETHLIPKSLDALPIEMYTIDAGFSSRGTEAVSVRGSSALVFGLKVNDKLLATISARVTIDIEELANFGPDEAIDQIGRLLKIQDECQTGGDVAARLDSLWPALSSSFAETASPPAETSATELPSVEALNDLTSVLKVLVETQPTRPY
eukprot:Gregarina_sp_Pseudo_9__603@NODE_1386_length_1644_cov_4_986916_g1292_i0_p1_GENE_NODE_1386_length_1644_cov_4_986916_g1292_i0NODE_1386_length_1644_cov_4_986916_g1292_i0_p1_ORF_typecomplete_len517_score130_43Nup88/PF10168_9/0_12DUF4407/PF14362_6/0_23Atg14/PF10186_9/0_74DUF4872/PF16169_5/0_56DUF4872/PF16169_5/4_3e03DUF4872/PF16169_5/5_1e03Gluconate_2dh3/PF13618_6/32KfrA_N/PF11740_8/1_8e04KfrA_N/PF11740_8/0_83T7SS_ESX_EspC/PF10824_8/0_15T7SS_ESX_EspC/PF10824_8/1_5e04T7SS_ESX_EspC/PF10824_8/1_3e04_NODE